MTIAVLPDTSMPFKTSSPVELQPNLRAIVRAETGDESVLKAQDDTRSHAVHPLAQNDAAKCYQQHMSNRRQSERCACVAVRCMYHFV